MIEHFNYCCCYYCYYYYYFKTPQPPQPKKYIHNGAQTHQHDFRVHKPKHLMTFLHAKNKQTKKT